jgi:hypothetical protein
METLEFLFRFLLCWLAVDLISLPFLVLMIRRAPLVEFDID